MANEVFFSGNLGSDPETRTAGETTVTELRIAHTDKWKGNDGEIHEKTTWMTINVWGKGGEAIAKHRSKGDWIGIFGSIEVQDWEDKEGNKRTGYSIRARSRDSIVWGGKSSEGGSKSGAGGGDYGKSESPPPSGMDDDIPF